MKKPQKIMQPGDYCNDFARIDDDVLWGAYCKDNYIVKYTSGNTKSKKLAVVYFSDNSLYDIAENDFYQRIVVENRYEWEKFAVKNADMHIFVRDVFLKAYFYGINSQIDDIEKLAEFLKSVLDGYEEVVMIGSCAGGYAAALIGSKLKVSRILSFSGQFNPPELGRPNDLSGEFGVLDMEEMVSHMLDARLPAPLEQEEESPLSMQDLAGRMDELERRMDEGQVHSEQMAALAAAKIIREEIAAMKAAGVPSGN